ncbi:MAG TPA: GntR family transcriptional regulator [Bacteroidales bacterium]|nr:GntR family transcriptional regulator [Bacteroidales bacterium]
MQIAEYFCENILKKEWKENEKIPSVREIAVEVEVNPNTAIRAYTFLQDQGIIYNKRGIGYFVAEDGYEKALQMRKEEFIQKDLPSLFKTMELLTLKLDDLIHLYNKHYSLT